MSTFTDAPQDTLFDLPSSPPEVAPDPEESGQPAHAGVPAGNLYSTAVTYLGQVKTGQKHLPASAHPHLITVEGAVSPNPTVWDTPGRTRIAAPATVRFTPEQADALLLAWIVLHKTPGAPLGAFVHGAAVRECGAYVVPLLTGHTMLHVWFQHAEALHAITKHADAAVVSLFTPRRPPAGMTPAAAGRVDAMKVGGWRPFLVGLNTVRKNLRAAEFLMGTGRPLTVGAGPNASA